MDPEPIRNRVSMREIARLSGVSHVTVSMALRDDPRISTATREKIQRTARELGYRPDPMLSALNRYRKATSAQSHHSTIAWINGWENPEELRGHREFELYWQGASECAARFGYQLEEFRIRGTHELKQLHQTLQARKILGIMLPPHDRRQPDWTQFPWEHYIVARFGRTVRHPPAHLVTADQLINTYTAVGKMRERGYHRIGLITQTIEDDPRGPHFTAGFLSAREQLHDEESLPMFFFDKDVTPSQVTRFREWMEAKKPEALLTTDNACALFRDAGYRVPEDIPLAVTSILDGGADSGMDQHPEEIGRVGMLLLNSLINDGARGIPEIFRQSLVEGTWVDGTSLPDRRT